MRLPCSLARECADLVSYTLPCRPAGLVSSRLSTPFLVRPSSSLPQTPSIQMMQRPILLMPCCRSTTHSLVARAHTGDRGAPFCDRACDEALLRAAFVPRRAEQDGASCVAHRAQTRLGLSLAREDGAYGTAESRSGGSGSLLDAVLCARRRDKGLSAQAGGTVQISD